MKPYDITFFTAILFGIGLIIIQKPVIALLLVIISMFLEFIGESARIIIRYKKERIKN